MLDRRYELRQRLGGGAMGDVWLGYDRRSRRAVAVKLIHREWLDPRHGSELAERFRREAGLLARLHHPGIPALLDVGLTSEYQGTGEHTGATEDAGAGQPYLVMDYILGQTLAEIVQEQRRLPEEQVVSIAEQICDVLEYTHAIPVVHRDLKPANIMLASRRVVVLDFGVARMFRTDQARLTQGNRVLGTVGYMPPEQCAGRDVSPRSDLYSLACLLYELLTGIPPFTGSDPATVMYHHQYRTPESVGLLRPGVAPALEAVIMAGLAKKPGERPATAREFRQRLVGLPGQAGGTGAADQVGDGQAAEPFSVEVRIIQAQALFDEGLIGEALPRFARLARDLARLGPQHTGDLARCRILLARCRTCLGHPQEALKDLQALADQLVPARPADDTLLLEVRFRAGQLLIDLGDQHGVSELAEVYRLLRKADRPQDAAMTAEVRRAFNRATLS
ncbi:protein kinase [Micromonospora sp. NPDC049275]|uniref:serine/threonine-protein kinase n=1 Tax=Micromonospora sp. NPDC049275 TaxID=3364268 RepID=UPI00371717CB